MAGGGAVVGDGAVTAAAAPEPVKKTPLGKEPPRFSAFLTMGHISALISVTTAASASRYGSGARLPAHGWILLSMLLPLRFLLWSFQQPKVLTKTHYALFLALGASATFASGALHTVAARIAPDWMLILIASSALDIGALWMRMAATVHEPSRGAFPFLFECTYAVADFALASVLGHWIMGEPEYLASSVGVRAVLNVCRLAGASHTILRVDHAKRKR